jgi:hypothetical protein
MNKPAILIGLLIVGALVGSVLFSTRHNRLELEGTILKVRSYQIDPRQTVAVLDIRFHNPSTQPFAVRSVEVECDGKSGGVFTEEEARRLFQYYPVLGEKYNQTLLPRDAVAPGKDLDRMLAVRFDTSDEEFQKRKSLRITVLETDRAKRVIEEKR